MTVLRCDQIREALPDKKIGYCCPSCHEDEDHGYAEMPSTWIDNDAIALYHCCQFMRDVDLNDPMVQERIKTYVSN